MLGLAAAAACGNPDIKSDLDTEGPPEVNIVTVSSETLGEVPTFCRDADTKINEFYCLDSDEDGTLDTFQVADAPALGWQVRIVLSELVQADLVEDLIRDEEGVVLGGTIANTRPVTIDCGGANTDVAYGGFYDPSGNHLTDPPGPSIVVEFGQFVATGSTCGVTLKADIVRDKDGQSVPSSLAGPYQFGISALRIDDTSPAADETGVAIDTVPLVVFNAPIAQSSIGTLVTLEDLSTDPPTPVTATVFADDQDPLVAIQPDADLTPNTQYRVTVNPGLTDIDGGALAIETPFTFTFTTGDPPSM